MIEDLRKQIIDEIRSYHRGSESEPGDITTDDVANELGLSIESARLLMMRLVKEGKFTRLKARINGHTRFVFRKIR